MVWQPAGCFAMTIQEVKNKPADVWGNYKILVGSNPS
jgi:hypothetical protein